MSASRLKFVWFLVLAMLGWVACSSPSSVSSPTLQPGVFQTAVPTPLPASPTDQITPATAGKPQETPQQTNTLAPSPTAAPLEVRFAVIGDYGQGNQAEADVANLVKSWGPDIVITTGDNNYPSGSLETIDHHIGQFYHPFISPYLGSYGAGAEANRFFPTLGNHDWDTLGAQAYFDYFVLPGNERYYDFTWGPVHFFALNSDSREPDGVASSSIQAGWLQGELASSEAAWKLVYGHHPPYSSGLRGPVDWMRWPFKEWGATVYLAGHDHFYERLLVDGFPYFINGLGGGPIYDIGPPAPGSQFRYNADYGAMLVAADSQHMTFQFINRQGEVIDEFHLQR
jgi:hypothetical protein